MAKTGDILVGLDIGTTKICAIVGEVTDEGIDIIGIGTHPSKGLRKGVVVNIDATVASIKRAIEEAEHMAGCEITTVYTSTGSTSTTWPGSRPGSARPSSGPARCCSRSRAA